MGRSDIHDLINHDDEPPDIAYTSPHVGSYLPVTASEPRHDKPPDHAEIRSEEETGDRRCVECNATDTPEWRKGPDGPHT